MKLSSIASLTTGYPFRGKIPEHKGSNIIAVQMKDTSVSQGIIWNHCIETRLPGIRTPAFLQSGDVLFAARGNHNYAILVDDIPNNIQVVAAPHFYVIRCHDTKKVLPAWLVWWLNEVPCQQYFLKNTEGSLTKSIRRNVLADTPVVLSAVSKQQTLISLSKIIKQEQHTAEALIQQNQLMMNAIAFELLHTQS